MKIPYFSSPLPIVIAAILLLTGSTFGVLHFKESSRLEAKVKANAEWAKLYEEAKAGDKLLKKEKNNFENYLSAGFRWKSLADATGEAAFYKKSFAVYEKSTKKWPGQFLSFINSANVLKYLKEFEKAEDYYLKATKLNPGESSTYIAWAEMQRYSLNRSPEEMKKFYESTIKILIGQENMAVTIDYAAYLRDTGQFAAALDLYKKLALVKPNFEPYQLTIKDLEDKLKAEGKNQSKE